MIDKNPNCSFHSAVLYVCMFCSLCVCSPHFIHFDVSREFRAIERNTNLSHYVSVETSKKYPIQMVNGGETPSIENRRGSFRMPPKWMNQQQKTKKIISHIHNWMHIIAIKTWNKVNDLNKRMEIWAEWSDYNFEGEWNSLQTQIKYTFIERIKFLHEIDAYRHTNTPTHMNRHRDTIKGDDTHTNIVNQLNGKWWLMIEKWEPVINYCVCVT